jgi:hypothetical protein
MTRRSNDIMSLTFGAVLLIVVSDSPSGMVQPPPGTRTAIELIGNKPVRRGGVGDTLGRSVLLAPGIGMR